MSGQKGNRSWVIKTDDLLAFEFINQQETKGIYISLTVGPGDQAYREKIFEIVKTKGKTLSCKVKSPGMNWQSIFRYSIFSPASADADLKKNAELSLARLRSFSDSELDKVNAELDEIANSL